MKLFDDYDKRFLKIQNSNSAMSISKKRMKKVIKNSKLLSPGKQRGYNAPWRKSRILSRSFELPKRRTDQSPNHVLGFLGGKPELDIA